MSRIRLRQATNRVTPMGAMERPSLTKLKALVLRSNNTSTACAALVCTKQVAPDCLKVYVSATSDPNVPKDYICQRCRSVLGLVPMAQHRPLRGRSK